MLNYGIVGVSLTNLIEAPTSKVSGICHKTLSTEQRTQVY